MKRLSIILFSLITTTVMAGNEGPGGGKGIVCRSSQGKVLSVEALDTYEARLRQIPVDLGVKNLSKEQKLDLAIQRLVDRGDAHRAGRYQAAVRFFLDPKNVNFVTHTKLSDTEDSFELTVPEGCAVEQVIIQKKPAFPEDKLYTINKDLWDILDNDNKAIFILHEVIYQELQKQVSWDRHDSTPARYFNSYIFSGKLKNLSVQDYFSFLLKFAKLERVTYKSSPIEINQIGCCQAPEFADAETLKVAHGIHDEGAVIRTRAGNIPIESNDNNEAYFRRLVVDFHPNGVPSHFMSATEVTLTINGQPVKIGWEIPVSDKLYKPTTHNGRYITDNEFWFHPNGELAKVTPYGTSEFIFKGKQYRPHTISLDDSGNVTEIIYYDEVLGKDVTVTGSN